MFCFLGAEIDAQIGYPDLIPIAVIFGLLCIVAGMLSIGNEGSGGGSTLSGRDPFGVHLNAFASFAFGTKEFPLSDIPMQHIIDRVADGTYKAKPAKVFPFEQIADAHRLMESNGANGKIVVVR